VNIKDKMTTIKKELIKRDSSPKILKPNENGIKVKL
jgi:hypothetical protein